MASQPLIVGLGGTTRPASTSERALQHTMARLGALGFATQVFGSAQMPREPYDPTRPERSPEAAALVDALRRCEGVVIATPAYHGGISGLVKNAIDFTEDLRADARVYLDGRAVGCIVCAEGAQAMGSTLASLRAIVHALRGWPTPYSATLNSRDKPMGGEGQAADPSALEACATVGRQVAEFAHMKRAMR
jgi:FMN reductase